MIQPQMPQRLKPFGSGLAMAGSLPSWMLGIGIVCATRTDEMFSIEIKGLGDRKVRWTTVLKNLKNAESLEVFLSQ